MEALKTGKKRSFNTSRAQRLIAKTEFKKLGKMFKGLKLKNLKVAHVLRLVDRWKSEGLSIGTQKNRMSVVRTVAECDGVELPKSNLEFGIENREIDYNTDKAWMPSKTLQDGLPSDLQLHVDLMYHFGLRFEEGAKFRVLENDQRGNPEGDRIFVDYGPKNGRDRYVPITTQAQRDLLDRLHVHVKNEGKDSLIPRGEKYIEWKDRAEYIYRDAGMTKRGVGTCHGLRHAYFQGRYEILTGWVAPAKLTTEKRKIFRSLMSKELREKDREVRQILSFEAGHGRYHVTANYVGSW